MNKIKKFLILFIAIYLGTYSWFSTNGTYSPKAYGVRMINGQHTISSKKFGLVWVPKFPEKFNIFYYIIYFPITSLDRIIVHREKEEF